MEIKSTQPGDIEFDGLTSEERLTVESLIPQVPRSLLEAGDIGERRVHRCNGEVRLRIDLVKFGEKTREITQRQEIQTIGDIDGLPTLEEAYEFETASSIADAQAEKGVLDRQESFIQGMNGMTQAIEESSTVFHADIETLAGDLIIIRLPPSRMGEPEADILLRGANLGVEAQKIIKKHIGLDARIGLSIARKDQTALEVGTKGFTFCAGDYWKGLYEIESATAAGKVWMDEYSSQLFPHPQALTPVENKGRRFLEINPDLLIPSGPVPPRGLVVSAKDIQFLKRFGRELPQTSENRSEFVIYAVIEGSIGTTEEEILDTLDKIADGMETTGRKFGLNFWKTDISPSGDLVLLGLYEGNNGESHEYSPPEATVRGALDLQAKLEILDLTMKGCAHCGPVLRGLVGSRKRTIYDAMGRTINETNRQAQRRGLVVTQAMEPHLAAINIEPGTPVLLHEAKELTEGVTAFLVKGAEDLRRVKSFMNPGEGLLIEFEDHLKQWAVENGIERFDWDKVLDLVSQYVTLGDHIFSPNPRRLIDTRVVLEHIAVQLRADLRAVRSTKQIEVSMAAAAANSSEIQGAIAKLKLHYEDAMKLVAVITGGTKSFFYERTITDTGRILRIETMPYQDYLISHGLITVNNDGQVLVFPPLQQGIYKSMGKELRQEYHAAIAKYLRDTVATGEPVDETRRSGWRQRLQAFVYHAYESHDERLVQDLRRTIPIVISHLREQNNFGAIRQQADWFLQLFPEERVRGLLWKSEALLQLGAFADAHQCYLELMQPLAEEVFNPDFPFWEIRIEEAFTRTFVEDIDPNQDPNKALEKRQKNIQQTLAALSEILDRVSGNPEKGLPANPRIQALALRRIGEILARTEGIDKEQLKQRYGERLRLLFGENIQFFTNHPELWGTVAAAYGRLGGGISAVLLAKTYLESHYSPAYAYSLAALNLTVGNYYVAMKSVDPSFEGDPETVIRRGLFYAKKSQNKQKMWEAINNLADWLIKQSRLGENRDSVELLIQEALELSDRLQHWYMKGASRELKGLLYLRLYVNLYKKDPVMAQQYLGEALTNFHIAKNIFVFNHAYGSEGLGMFESDIAQISGDVPHPPALAEFIVQLPKLQVHQLDT